MVVFTDSIRNSASIICISKFPRYLVGGEQGLGSAWVPCAERPCLCFWACPGLNQTLQGSVCETDAQRFSPRVRANFELPQRADVRTAAFRVPAIPVAEWPFGVSIEEFRYPFPRRRS